MPSPRWRVERGGPQWMMDPQGRVIGYADEIGGEHKLLAQQFLAGVADSDQIGAYFYQGPFAGRPLTNVPAGAQAWFTDRTPANGFWPNGGSDFAFPSGSSTLVIDVGTQFNLVPDGPDNASAFDALNTFLQALVRAQQVELRLPSGDFFTTRWDLLTLSRPGSSLIIRGHGSNNTRIIPLAGAQSPVMTVGARDVNLLIFDGWSMPGNGTANMSGIEFYPVWNTTSTVGGVTRFIGRDWNVGNFDGTSQTWLGGAVALGTPAYRIFNQFLTFDNCGSKSLNSGTTWEFFGQTGQVNFINGWCGGDNPATQGGPGMYVGDDYRGWVMQPSAVDTTAEVITLTANVQYPPNVPVRIIGSAQPGGLNKGQTYWIGHRNRGGTSPNLAQISFASTRQNAGIKTWVDLTSVGTPANWQIVGLWTTATPTANQFTTDQQPKIYTGLQHRYVGANLPTGLSTGVDYFFIRDSRTQWRVASSFANAIAGTAIAVSGGTPADWGIQIGNGDGLQLHSAYSINFDNLSIGGKEVSLYARWVANLKINLHIEWARRCLELHHCESYLAGGFYQKSGDDGGQGCFLINGGGGFSRFNWAASGVFFGACDKYYHNDFGAMSGDGFPVGSRGQAAPAVASTGTNIQVSIDGGGNITVGAYELLLCNTSVTTCQNFIGSQHMQRQTVTIRAFGGSVVFGNSGNLSGFTGATLTCPDGCTTTWQRTDLIGVWQLVGRSF